MPNVYPRIDWEWLCFVRLASFVSPVAYLVVLDHLDHQHEINLDHYRR